MAGIILRREEGKHVYYQADQSSPLFPELRGLMIKTAGLVDVIREALGPLAKRIRLAFIFGSIAKGTETGASDIDLLVLGDTGLSDLALPLRTASERLSRELNPVVYNQEEFKRRASSESFVSALLDKERLFVIGTENDLEEALGRSARRARASARGRVGSAPRAGRTKPR